MVCCYIKARVNHYIELFERMRGILIGVLLYQGVFERMRDKLIGGLLYQGKGTSIT